MVQTAKTVGENRYRESFGRHYEDFCVGDVYEHRPGRTISEADNTWFTLLTMNTHPLHFDAEYAKASEFGKCIVCSPFTVALMVGMSVSDVSQKAIANLGWTGRRHRDRQDHRAQPARHRDRPLRAQDPDRQARPQRRRQSQLLKGRAMTARDNDEQAFVDAVEVWAEKELRPVA